jgi:hypothetical protein
MDDDTSASFGERVARVLARIDPDCRGVADDDVRSLLDAGVACEADLFAIVEDAGSGAVRRARSFWLLSRLGTPGTAPALFEALSDPSAVVRAGAARAIGESAIAASTDRLAAVLRQDPDAEVRRAAAYALGLVGDPGADASASAAWPPRHWWTWATAPRSRRCCIC